MAIDDVLTNRLHDALEDLDNISRKKMMGGVCFMLNGNMLCGADRTKEGYGRFMFRVGKENEAKALSQKGAKIMQFGSRRMGGLIFVDEKACNKQTLKSWVKLAHNFVGELPPK